MEVEPLSLGADDHDELDRSVDRAEPVGCPGRELDGLYVVVAGSGRAKLEAGPEGLDLICIGGRKPKGGDTERITDFWD